MKTASQLREEAEHWRQLATLVTDEQARRALEELIEELERRARELEEETD